VNIRRYASRSYLIVTQNRAKVEVIGRITRRFPFSPWQRWILESRAARRLIRAGVDVSSLRELYLSVHVQNESLSCGNPAGIVFTQLLFPPGLGLLREWFRRLPRALERRSHNWSRTAQIPTLTVFQRVYPLRASNPWEKARVMCQCPARERRECISNKSHEDELDYEKLYGRVIFWLFSVTRQNEKFVVGCLLSTDILGR